MAHILVVDDDYAFAAVLVALLTEQGHTVQCAYDGETALARIRARPPDLLITDLMLPFVSGGQVLAAVRAEPGLATIPVVVVSALPAGSAGLPEGVVYLRKPVSLEQVEAALQQLLRGGPDGEQAAPG